MDLSVLVRQLHQQGLADQLPQWRLLHLLGLADRLGPWHQFHLLDLAGQLSLALLVDPVSPLGLHHLAGLADQEARGEY